MKNYFKLILIFCCFIFIYYNLNDNDNFIVSFLNLKLSDILIISLLSIFSIIIYSKLILLFLRYFSKLEISLSKWNLIYFNSQFLNSIPFLGIFYRAIQLKKLNVDYKIFFIIYMMINWIYLTLTLLIISLEIFIFIPNYKIFDISGYYLTFFSGLILIILPMIISFCLSLTSSNIFNQNYILKLNYFFSFFDVRKFKLKFILILISLFICLHVIELIIFFKLTVLVKPNITFINSYLIFIGSAIIDSINVLPQNILFSEIGYGLVTQNLEQDFSLGVVIKLYSRFIIFNSAILIAIIYNVYNYTLKIKHE